VLDFLGLGIPLVKIITDRLSNFTQLSSVLTEEMVSLEVIWKDFKKAIGAKVKDRNILPVILLK